MPEDGNAVNNQNADDEVVDIFDIKEGDGDPLALGANPTEDEAADNADPAPEANIPVKFKGKSLEDVISMYTNLESAHGRRANELGDLRKLTDQILLQTAAQEPKAEAVTIDRDDLLDDPMAVINKAVANHPAVRKAEATAAELTKADQRKQFESKHGPVSEAGSNPEFLNWVQSNQFRMERFKTAASTEDYIIADELLDTWAEINKARSAVTDTQRTKDQDALATPKAGSGGSAAVPTGKVTRKPKFRRSDLMRLRVEDPRRYAAMQPEILDAYAEKRVI